MLFALAFVGATGCGADDPCAGVTCETGACDEETGQCEPPSCDDVGCERGVCDSASGQCVSAETCEAADGHDECIGGEKCLDGDCLAQQAFCEQLECARGVCDFAAAECANADSCTQDAECVDGFYCTDSGDCAENKCSDDGQTCPRGVCDKSTGECANPPSCGAVDDCLDGFVCVETNSGGTCVTPEEACGESGCPGNQICEYDESELSGACRENTEEGCTNAVDCIGERACAGELCLDAMACPGDVFEANETASQAVDLLADARLVDYAASASLCESDVDFYTYDTAAAVGGRGTLVVEVDVADRDVGLGVLTLDVYGPDDTVVASETTAEAGVARAEVPIGPLSQGVYTIRVDAADEVLSPGVDYTLFTRLLPDEALDACADAPTIAPGDTVQGNTSSGLSAALESACVEPNEASIENIYRFEVAEPSRVELAATPTGSADVTVGLRSACERADTELSCADRADVAGPETLSALLDPGSYYAVVQPARAALGGAYELTLSTTPTNCAPADSYCEDQQTARVCKNGSGVYAENCASGCDFDTGRCAPLEGESCAAPTRVEGSLSESIAWGSRTDDVEIGAGSCLPGQPGSNATGGPDAVYAITLGPDQGMTAKLTLPRGDDGALYLVQSCAAASSSCLAGNNSTSQDGVRELDYLNDTGRPLELYLVADAPASQTQGVADIDIAVSGVVCEPGTRRCDGDTIQLCNGIGTTWQDEYTCNFGCNAGRCNQPTNDTCSSPVDLTSGVTITQRINNYFPDYNPGYTSCADSTSQGPDAVYRVTTTQPNQSVEVSVDAEFDAVIYVVEACDALAASCVAGGDEAGVWGREEVSFFAPQPRDYYVVVDSRSAAAIGVFDITADIRNASCTPGEVLGCSTKTAGVFEYCDALGNAVSHSCDSGSCSNGYCDNPTGKSCAEAIALSDGDTVSGDFQGTNALHFPNGRSGQCFFSSGSGTEGNDDMYRVELQPGELLEATLDTTDEAARLYFLEDCARDDACVGGSPESGSQTKYYASENGGSVIVVVDRESDNFTTATYDLSVEVIANRVCRPEQPSCADATTVQVCNLSGTAYDTTYDCPSGCMDGACIGDPNVASCANAPDVGEGIYVYGDFNLYSDDVSLGAADCLPDGVSERGKDAVYKVSLNSGDVLRADVESMGDEAPLIYVVEDCSDAANTCLAGDAEDQGNNRASITYTADAAKDVYVVVDSEFGNPNEPFALRIDKRQPQCTPGASTCDADGQTLLYCNRDGVYEPHLCASGACSSGSCDSPSGDVCLEPIQVSAGDTVTGDWTGTDAVYLPEGRSGQCFFATGDEPRGPDTVYQIDLQPGDLLRADLTTGDASALLYFLEDCTAADSCVGGAQPSGDQTRYFHSETGGPVNVVVDRAASAPSAATYSLSFDVTPNMACRPGQPRCVDATTVEVCDATGATVLQQFNCADTCVDGACTPKLPESDACGNAPFVGAGVSLYSSFAEATNRVTIPAASCALAEGAGPELVHRISVAAGEVVRARVESFDGERPLVYFTRDCAAPADTCAAAGRSDSDGRVATAAFAATQSETLYVVADSEQSGASGPFSLLIEKLPSECTPGTRRCSPTSPDTVQVCRSSELYDDYACAGSCSNGTCTTPTGEACADAMPLGKNDTFVGSFGDYADDLNPGVGTCVRSFEFEPKGPDAVFAVDLSAGDVLRAQLDTQAPNAVMYMLDGCAQTARRACRWSQPRSEPLEFHADASQTYYLVVDYAETAASEAFELSLSTGPGGVCQPDGTTCDPATGQITGCNELGTATEYVAQCAHGCDGDLCAPPAAANDTCAQPYAVAGSTRLVDSFARFTDDASPSACGISGSNGPDAVYEVALGAGESLEATVEALDAFTRPYVYITTSCSAPGSGCVDGARAAEHVAQAGYHSTAGETVYVVVDSPYGPLDSNFLLDISVTPAECSSGDARCASSDVLETCSSYRVYQQEECSFGCNMGACSPAPNDLCGGAFQVPRDGATHTFTARIDAYSNDYDAAAAPGQSCTWDGFGGDTAGPDAVYRVDAQPGDVITVDYSGPGDEALWIADDCTAMAGSCQAGVDDQSSSGDERLVFVAPSAGSYFVVADVDTTATVSGEFTVDVTVTPQSCTPGAASCADATTLDYCTDLGTATAGYACAGSCTGPVGDASCTQPTGDICVDAIDATGGATFSVDMATLADTFDLPKSACLGHTTPGSDAIFAVDLTQGDTLTATATPPSGSFDDASIYVLQDCHRGAATNTSCLLGVDDASFGVAETLTYQATATGTVWVVVDSYGTASGTWTVDIAQQ